MDDRHRKALAKIRELEDQISVLAHRYVSLERELATSAITESAETVDLLQKIAASQSKFAKEAKELLP